MLASEVTFEQMRRAARNLEELGVSTSYMQVEYGLDELEACWDGFVHTSDHYGQTFKSKKAINLEFAKAINEYLEFIGESTSLEVGSQVYSDC